MQQSLDNITTVWSPDEIFVNLMLHFQERDVVQIVSTC